MMKTRSFAEQPESVPAARRFATKALAGIPAEALATVELLVSELATNCIRHTNSRFDLTIMHRGHEIRVEATDYAGGEPTMRSPKPTDPSGRGLRIVDTLSEAWGIEHRAKQGKTVWFKLTVPTVAPAHQLVS